MRTPRRSATPRRYLMCPPAYFRVSYSINPWMDPGKPVDLALAHTQWEDLRDRYRALGHTVEELPPHPAFPDMVFAANGATVVDGRVLGARFAFAERHGEAAVHAEWYRRHGFPAVREPQNVNEGEGDFVVTASWLLAGRGFRSSPLSHAEAQEYFTRPVIGLDLVDPRYYHLDTALCVLDPGSGEPGGAAEVMYYPGAFSAGSRAVLRRLFPDALLMRPGRRGGVRAERGVRRAACAAAPGRGGALRPAAGAGVRADRDGSHRAAEGRGEREVCDGGVEEGVTAALSAVPPLGNQPWGQSSPQEAPRASR